MLKKIIFIDRDGTLIDEPIDKQVDCISKISLKTNVIPALLMLIKSGYLLVIVSNQDGLGTGSFKTEDFRITQEFLIQLFNSQGIHFDSILICPHFENENCTCRKPMLGLVIDYLREGKMDYRNSYMIGDRSTDMQFAKNMGINGFFYDGKIDWLEIAKELTTKPRSFTAERKTLETKVIATVNLDQNQTIMIDTGLAFLDHMIEQLAKHGGFSLILNVKGDLHIDEHHTVEDAALTLGEALRGALGNKLGINRYGFLLPMDESKAEIAIDLSGRSYFSFNGNFTRDKVGDLPTELVSHFFRSLAETLGAAIHIKFSGENTHHLIECIFKGVGRSLGQAFLKKNNELPTTKGVI